MRDDNPSPGFGKEKRPLSSLVVFLEDAPLGRGGITCDSRPKVKPPPQASIPAIPVEGVMQGIPRLYLLKVCPGDKAIVGVCHLPESSHSLGEQVHTRFTVCVPQPGVNGNIGVKGDNGNAVSPGLLPVLDYPPKARAHAYTPVLRGLSM